MYRSLKKSEQIPKQVCSRPSCLLSDAVSLCSVLSVQFEAVKGLMICSHSTSALHNIPKAL